ncbi:MAG: caspase family protein [bacterium]|nr:caspase family protein [bacterium]
MNNKSFDAAKYAVKYNKPGIISQRLRAIAPPKKFQAIENTHTPPTIVVNYVKCGDKIIDDISQSKNIEVDSPNILLAVTAVGNRLPLKTLTIKINGQEIAEKKASGNEIRCKPNILLKDHTNHIQITATNSKNQKTTNTITIAYDNTIPKKSLSEIFKKVKSSYSNSNHRNWAVLIAVKNYSTENNGLTPLPYAVRDAEAVKEYLINRLHFNPKYIRTLYNKKATRDNINKILGETMPRSMTENDRILVYFSGHGGKEIMEKANNISKTFSYLVPFDGNKKSLFSTGISIEQVNKFSDRLPAKQVLFIFDACFSGNAGDIYGKGNQELEEETKKKINYLLSKRGRHLLTAGTEHEEAQMGGSWNNHSVYTYYLLEGLKGKADTNQDQVVSLYELQTYLRRKITKDRRLLKKKKKMTPQLFILPDTDGGEFIFFTEGEN